MAPVSRPSYISVGLHASVDSAWLSTSSALRSIGLIGPALDFAFSGRLIPPFGPIPGNGMFGHFGKLAFGNSAFWTELAKSKLGIRLLE
jgi:hypothetical protein